MTKAAVKIEAGGETYRYATHRLVVDEEIGGQTYSVHYIPYVLEVSPVTSEIAIESDPAIPTIRVKIWDGYGEVSRELEKQEFESTVVTVTLFDEDDNEIGVYPGYMSQPSFTQGEVQFTVRLEEDGAEDRYLNVFSFNTFQKTKILTPKNLELSPQYEYNEDTPWAVEGTVVKGGHLAEAVEPGDTTIKIAIDANDPYAARFDSARYYFEPLLEGGGIASSGVWEQAVNGLCTFVQSSNIVRYNNVNDHRFFIGTGATHFLIVGSEGNDGLYTIATVQSSYIQVAGATPIAADGQQQGVRIYPGVIKERFPAVRGKIILGTRGRLSSEASQFQVTPTATTVEVIEHNGNGISYQSSPPTIEIQAINASGPYAIKHTHPPGVTVHPEGQNDQIIVASGNFVPLDKEEGIMSVGFCHLEDHVEVHPITGREFRVTNRYRMKQYNPQALTSKPTGEVVVLELHDQHLSSNHEFAVKGIMNVGYQIHPVETGTRVQFVDFKWAVSRLDYVVSHIGANTSEYAELLEIDGNTFEETSGQNRLRGRRVDMLVSVEDLYKDARFVERGITVDSTVLSEQNQNMVNNARRFAVATGSKLYYEGTNASIADKLVETMWFHTPEWGSVQITSGYVEGEEVEDLGYDPTETIPELDIPYTNLLTYSSTFNGATSQSGDDLLGKAEAKRFFLKQSFRLITDPVPQNSSDLGKVFPVVYGYVERVPLLQVISEKTLMQDEVSAGDDVYIYASHPCLISNAEDIVLEIDIPEERQKAQQVERPSGLPPSLNRKMLENPFPKRADNHIEVASGSTNSLQQTFLNNPYHKLVTKTSLQGDDYFGIQLRGKEWDPEVGRSDARYPIRHGLGNSVLLGTFAGMVDENRQLIQHPIDVVEAHIKRFGRYPYTEDRLDQSNMEKVKSLTRRLRVGVYLTEQMSIGQLTSKLCSETGLLWYLSEGKIRFAFPDISLRGVDWAKPLSQGLNLIHGVEAKDAGSQVAFSRVLYRYRKNGATGDYEGVIDLNASNNRWCARANKAVGSKREFEISADWVNAGGVAMFAAQTIASRVARHRIEYSADALYRDGILFQPGDMIPMTDESLGLNKTPVLVKEVEYGEEVQGLTLIRFL